METVIGAIISTGEALGPFGLVIMVVGTTGSIGVVFLTFKVAKDVPVVGALA